MQRYRIAVGRTHHVKPGDIVGALANEAGIASRHIGHIKLFDDFSTVDLPKTLAKETLRQLKTLRVRNQVLDIRMDEGPGGESFAPRRKNDRSEEHTSELQSRGHLVCRLLLEKKNKTST